MIKQVLKLQDRSSDLDALLERISKEELYSFRKSHTLPETRQHFQLSARQLRSLLVYYNIIIELRMELKEAREQRKEEEEQRKEDTKRQKKEQAIKFYYVRGREVRRFSKLDNPEKDG